MGQGGGNSRGWRRRNWFHATDLPRWQRFETARNWATPAAEPERQTLEAQAQWLKLQLDAVKERLSGLGREG
jgi:hypothetical protein